MLWRRLRCWYIPRLSLSANAFVARRRAGGASLFAALVIADSVIAAPLVVRKPAHSNCAPLANVISALPPGDSIIGIGNALIVVVSRNAVTCPPRHCRCPLKLSSPKKT